MPFGQVPCLEVDGKKVAQSVACLRFAGKKAGLYSDDLVEAALIDGYLDYAGELDEVRISVASILFILRYVSRSFIIDAHLID